VLATSPSASPSADYVFPRTGEYLFIIHIQGGASTAFQANVDVEMKGPSGYLSVIDYPLLVFYGCMCAAYVLMGIAWLVLCAMHWRDLLRQGDDFENNVCHY
jgi:hypothetical protein